MKLVGQAALLLFLCQPTADMHKHTQTHNNSHTKALPAASLTTLIEDGWRGGGVGGGGWHWMRKDEKNECVSVRREGEKRHLIYS